MNPQRTINLDKVQWCDYYWINGKGDEQRTEPKGLWVNGVKTAPHAIAFPYQHEYPNETLHERAIRLGLVDKWKPVCKIIISANRTLTYAGDKATNFWKAYNAHIYGK